MNIKIKFGSFKIPLNFLIILISFIYCSPDFFVKNSLFSTRIFYIRLVCSFIAILVWMFSIKKEKYIKNFLNYYLVYCLICVISTLINNGDMIKIFGNSLNTIGLIIWTGIIFQGKYKTVFKIYIFYLFGLIIINWLFLFIFPNGYAITEDYYRFNFLGIDNNTTPYVLVVCCGLYYFYVQYKYESVKFLYMLGFILAAGQIFWLKVGTGILGILVFFVLILIDKYLSLEKVFKPNFFIVFFLIFGICAVLLKPNNLIADFVAKLVDKDISFSGRTTIWKIVVNYIFLHPWLGYGIQTKNIVRTITEIERSYAPASHAHSQYLQIIVDTGVISLIPILALFFNLFRKARRKWNIKRVRILMYGIISFFIMAIGEVLFFDIFWQFLFIVYVLICKDKGYQRI
ncbi:O-antigen ligase family protein [Erysipelotrichaceae bacterium 66-17]|nr:hypothetical protein EROP_12140 [Erysipelotrichaceae bacterium OPF54]